MRQRPKKFAFFIADSTAGSTNARRSLSDLGVGEVRFGEKLVGERFHDLILNAAPCLATLELET
jgi:hypothetical protein